MFNNVQPFQQSRRALGAKIEIKDENSSQSVTFPPVKAIIGSNLPLPKVMPYATRAAIKRQALGDVSNVQPKIPLNEKTTRAKPTTNIPISSVATYSSGQDVQMKDSSIGATPGFDYEAKALALKYEAEEAAKKKALASPITVNWDDLDAEDEGDPMMVSEYVNDIFLYMRELEKKTMPDPNYIIIQKELKWQMRSVLVDWLIEVHWKLKLLPETLFMTVNLVDRFLSLRAVSVAKFQLVGITATMIASKYEEIVTPTVENFVFLTERTFDSQEILKAERYMLHVLEFVLCYPSPLSFLRRISKADGYDVRTRTVAKYLMEVILLDERFLSFPPSMISASAAWLARKMLNKGAWNPNLDHYSGYAESELSSCVGLLTSYFSKPVQFEAVFKKYSSKKFLKASLFVQEYAVKHFGLVV